MQVEVSKHTEGSKDKMLRPNGLPESLIRYDGIVPFPFCFCFLYQILLGQIIEPILAMNYTV